MESWKDSLQEGPMCWKKRTHSLKLPSDLHMQTLLYMLFSVHICMHKGNVVKKKKIFYFFNIGLEK